MPNFIEVQDSLNRSTVLRIARFNRTDFDPENAMHLDSLKKFIETGAWGDVTFHCEYPFTDVPMTVLIKYAGHMLGTFRETAALRLERTNALSN